MDGHFVPNITFGPDVVRAIRPCSRQVFDTHLMIAPVDALSRGLRQGGRRSDHRPRRSAGRISTATLQAIRALGKQAGVSLCPATPESAIEYVLGKLDLILVMTVNPGFGGQKFIPAMVEKIRRLRAMTAGRGIRIEVDGGINAETAPLVVAAGADVLVAGLGHLSGAARRLRPRTSRRSARRPSRRPSDVGSRRDRQRGQGHPPGPRARSPGAGTERPSR